MTGPRHFTTITTTILILAILLFVGCGRTTNKNVKRQPRPQTHAVLKAAHIQTPPVIDGIADDRVWRKAPELTVPTAGGPAVTMRAVYDDTYFYFSATWTDQTNDSVDEVWNYDGQTWTKGTIDDALAFFWNIDDSIPGFTKEGCRAVCHQRTDGTAAMEIVGPAGAGRKWSGVNQKGDIWDISLGISNVRGSVNDYVFSIDPAFLKFPNSVPPRIFRRHDYFTERAPMDLNYATDPADGKKKPKYMLKPGLTVDTTPYPFIDQVEKIEDYGVFKAGDRQPYIIFFPFTAKWGGSRDDISGKGVWRDGRWTVEFKRSLDTGQTDDIQFKVKKGEIRYYVFDVAVFDRTITDHKYFGPISLEIKP
ncbi:MAG: ethylbenzene dehydrogenase-related protein [Actinomycetota bacterium]